MTFIRSLMLSSLPRMKMGSSAHPRILLDVAFILSIFHTARASVKCNDDFLNVRCRKLFDGRYTKECLGEEMQLFPKCLFMASECKNAVQVTEMSNTESPISNYTEAYDALIDKVKLYRRCFSRRSLQCNESMIRDCYENFKQNKTKTCSQVHKLRFCVLLLRPRGCHEMRNPWYTLVIGMIKNYRSCFIRNYTILLEALQKKKPVPTTLLSDLAKNRTTVNMVTCGRSQNVLERKVGYTFFGALFFCFLVLLSVVFLVICIKKSGIPRKNRRTITESQAALGSETTHIDARYSRTCVAGGRTPLTYIIEEDEAPPPYYLDGMFVDDIESPPPYTSRPTSINGDFV